MSGDARQPAELTSLEQVQATVGPASPLAQDKVMDRLDRFARRFVELSPFLCIGSIGERGGHDVSPRGDPPGFVRVLDERTIVIPERVGNRRVDTLRNVVETGGVGIVFFVPGLGETLRVNGRATLVGPDSSLLSGLDVRGTSPLSGIVVHVEECFFHCARALLRSRLWDGEQQVGRDAFPSMGEVSRERMKLTDEQVRALEEATEQGYGRDLYGDEAYEQLDARLNGPG